MKSRRSAALPWAPCSSTSIVVSSAALTLASPRVHLQVGVLAKSGDLDEGRPIAQAQPLFGAPVLARRPRRHDELLQRVAGGATPQGIAQIGAVLGVQTSVPDPIGGEAAPVARRAKGGGGGRDDAEYCTVGESVAVGGRAARLPKRLDAAVPSLENGQHLV